MSEKFIDFDLNYRIERVGDKEMLVVRMPTVEFGTLQSPYLPAVDDQAINTALMDSLADDLIDEYLDRCRTLRMIPRSGKPVDQG